MKVDFRHTQRDSNEVADSFAIEEVNRNDMCRTNGVISLVFLSHCPFFISLLFCLKSLLYWQSPVVPLYHYYVNDILLLTIKEINEECCPNKNRNYVFQWHIYENNYMHKKDSCQQKMGIFARYMRLLIQINEANPGKKNYRGCSNRVSQQL